MNIALTHQFAPGSDNPRNSEGAFIRDKNGDILFAYSRYHGQSNHDHATCDIWLARSSDEGNSWSEPTELAKAEFFGVDNIMSVSAVEHNDGSIGFYYLIKENDMSTTLGRSVSYDGINFVTERCECHVPVGYYVINNDRIVRLKNGQLVAPAAFYTLEGIKNYEIKKPNAKVTAFLSDDDGKTWYDADFMLGIEYKAGGGRGLQEPGIIERENDLMIFMRTGLSCQYVSYSTTGINGFKEAQPSDFTSPNSPMQIKEIDKVMYAIYNPVPRYNGIFEHEGTWGRTPMVIRKSTDGGENWGEINVLADEITRGYCYPALFKTDDGHLLIGTCMGDAADGNTLCRLGIFKVEIDSIK